MLGVQEASAGAREPDGVRVLRRCFGLERDHTQRLPEAALTRTGESPDSDASLDSVHWLRADPVHLRPELTGMSMLPAESLDLDIEEVRALIGVLNAHFASEPFEFEAPTARRWYIRSREPFDLVTTPPTEAQRHELSRSLPAGPQAARWHGVLNEIQMALHGAAVNTQRSARGQPAVNSVWLWGEGTLEPSMRCPFANVWSDDPFARGLARVSGAHAGPLPERFDATATIEAASGGLLIHIDELGGGASLNDPRAWLDAVEKITAETIDPLLALLTDARIQSVRIEPGNARRFELSARSMRRWWRRRHKLQRWISLSRTVSTE